MTPLDAVAAAIRERLLAGRPAPLPGLGTLVRQHVASRIQERADGTRMLMPPGETIGLASESAAEHESLGLAFGRYQSLEGAQAVRAYRDAMDQIEARLAATGEVRLPGVGLLRRTSGGIILGVEADLLTAVNRTYEGLAPVTPAPSASVTPPEGSAEEEHAQPSPPSPNAPEVEVTVIGSSQDDAFGVPIHAAPEADDAEQEVPLRDLSSVPFSDPEDDLADDTPVAATLDDGWSFDPVLSDEVTGEAVQSEAESNDAEALDATLQQPIGGPGADEDSAVTEVDRPEIEIDEMAQPDRDFDLETAEGTQPAVEGAQASPEADEVDQPDVLPQPPQALDQSSADVPLPSADFVDEHTLDADLDELAVPFGGGTPLSDILPPTPPTATPKAEWASPETTPSSPLSFADQDTPEIEDAAYEIVNPDTSPIIERVGPSAELDALLEDRSQSADLPFAADPRTIDPFADLDLGDEPALRVADEPVVPATTSAATLEDDASRSGFPWWLIALALVLALALLAAWLWPRFATRTADATAPTEQAMPGPTRIEPTRAEPDDMAPAQPEVRTLDAPTPAPQADAPIADQPPREPSLARQPMARASGGGVAQADDPLPARPGLGQAPAAGYAISPPRVVGLTGSDVRALSGREPIDPEADAWTLVVLSTTSRDDANALSARYRSAGYRTGVVSSTSGDRSIYRVAVGQFTDRDQARRLSDRLPPQAPADSWPLDLRTL